MKLGTYDELVVEPQRIAGKFETSMIYDWSKIKPKSVGAMTHILGPLGERLFTVYVGGNI